MLNNGLSRILHWAGKSPFRAGFPAFMERLEKRPVTPPLAMAKSNGMIWTSKVGLPIVVGMEVMDLF